MARKLLALCVVLLFTAGTVLAKEKKVAGGQEKLTPAQQQEMIQQTMQTMTPFFGQVMKAMMEAQLDVLAQPETAERLAAYTRNYYEALVRKGFSKDEALRIAMAVGFPAFPGMQK